MVAIHLIYKLNPLICLECKKNPQDTRSLHMHFHFSFYCFYFVSYVGLELITNLVLTSIYAKLPSVTGVKYHAGIFKAGHKLLL